jgi:hypothetical protein
MLEAEFVKFQITNPKYQINNNDQNSKFETGGQFGLAFDMNPD